ncbi:uncharacterized protein K452DRAFT_302023 [Aplosporella prunicola CBS 121167]|uniref:Uncharacterized protein n=1 Tax=Aplosporella prunicola CBS 121167 TaxID=1176127 RepID=A0A6A6AZ92_9PEZI|nr:uncharacterized protein K452DRAFT_302023 [Aplosporella prunicola CBS 121167]KAF2137262.1 hypothetical protein K452DRAFT_302023 [Aplosporella prunicola CBS 121167]
MALSSVAQEFLAIIDRFGTIDMVVATIKYVYRYPKPLPLPASCNTAEARAGLERLDTPGANSPIAGGPTSLNAPLSQLTGHDWVGKSFGFQENFKEDIKSVYRQMMRCYAHLYHGHWLDPFWNLNAYKELNTCFIHLINVGKQFDHQPRKTHRGAGG